MLTSLTDLEAKMSGTEEKTRRTVVAEFSGSYVRLSLRGKAGKLIDQETFRYPFGLDSADIEIEAKDFFGLLYDYCNDTLNTDVEVEDDQK